MVKSKKEVKNKPTRNGRRPIGPRSCVLASVEVLEDNVTAWSLIRRKSFEERKEESVCRFFTLSRWLSIRIGSVHFHWFYRMGSSAPSLSVSVMHLFILGPPIIINHCCANRRRSLASRRPTSLLLCLVFQKYLSRLTECWPQLTECWPRLTECRLRKMNRWKLWIMWKLNTMWSLKDVPIQYHLLFIRLVKMRTKT